MCRDKFKSFKPHVMRSLVNTKPNHNKRRIKRIYPSTQGTQQILLRPPRPTTWLQRGMKRYTDRKHEYKEHALTHTHKNYTHTVTCFVSVNVSKSLHLRIRRSPYDSEFMRVRLYRVTRRSCRLPAAPHNALLSLNFAVLQARNPTRTTATQTGSPHGSGQASGHFRP